MKKKQAIITNIGSSLFKVSDQELQDFITNVNSVFPTEFINQFFKNSEYYNKLHNSDLSDDHYFRLLSLVLGIFKGINNCLEDNLKTVIIKGYKSHTAHSFYEDSNKGNCIFFNTVALEKTTCTLSTLEDTYDGFNGFPVVVKEKQYYINRFFILFYYLGLENFKSMMHYNDIHNGLFLEYQDNLNNFNTLENNSTLYLTMIYIITFIHFIMIKKETFALFENNIQNEQDLIKTGVITFDHINCPTITQIFGEYIIIRKDHYDLFTDEVDFRIPSISMISTHKIKAFNYNLQHPINIYTINLKHGINIFDAVYAKEVLTLQTLLKYKIDEKELLLPNKYKGELYSLERTYKNILFDYYVSKKRLFGNIGYIGIFKTEDNQYRIKCKDKSGNELNRHVLKYRRFSSLYIARLYLKVLYRKILFSRVIDEYYGGRIEDALLNPQNKITAYQETDEREDFLHMRFSAIDFPNGFISLEIDSTQALDRDFHVYEAYMEIL